MRNNETRTIKVTAYCVCILAIGELALILLSWILSSTFPYSHIKSMLNGEGIRWFFGSFTSNLNKDILVWMILSSIAYGVFVKSGLSSLMRKSLILKACTFRERMAFLVFVVEVILILTVMLLLTTLPQAILLSSTGNLIPSCFSNSLVAVVIFAMLVTSLTTGFITRRITTLVNAVKCMIYGMRIFSPLILMYVFSNQLYYSFCYTFIP